MTCRASTYDSASRLVGLSHDLAGTAQHVTFANAGYNPAEELGSRTRKPEPAAARSPTATALSRNQWQLHEFGVFAAVTVIPLYLVDLFFGGPELLGGKALLEFTGMIMLGAAGAAQSGICF